MVGKKVLDKYQKYLKGNLVYQVNHSSVKNQVICILKNKNNKVSGSITSMKKFKVIYYWLRNNVNYLINTDFDSVNVLKRTKTVKSNKNTNCTGHKNLLNALSRTPGIPVAYYYFKPVGVEHHVHSLIYIYFGGK